MVPGAQARPYKDFLTPSLHKRFADASFYTLILCFFIAVWMGDLDNVIWSWFPIGPAGIRTTLLFIPALIVYILRVAQYHVGRRNTQTPWETFSKYTLRQNTFMTIACYSLSAWFYTEVYIWGRSGNDRLGFTEQGKYHERIKLNERPFFLRFLFIVLAVAQGIVHLWKDYDKIEIPAMKPKKEREGATATEVQMKPRQALTQQLKPMGIRALALATLTLIAGTTFYFLGFRYIFWEYYFRWARWLVSLSKTSKPTGLPPFIPLVMMFMAEGSLLALLWQFVNLAFNLYISQEPLKKDKPITSDSKDPNGSLLNGLKSKKNEVKAVAFWELALITDRFLERRKTIYGELNRKKAATFKQVSDICLAEIRLLTSRINIALDPKYSPADAGQKKQPEPISLVPQIAQPLKDGQIKGPGYAPTTRMEKFGSLTADIAKTHSSPQNAQSAYAREYLKKGQEKFSQGAKEAETIYSSYFSKLVASPLGWPFRASLRRTASLIITGAPYSQISLLCNAVTTLTNLTVYSIKEDEYGRFQEEVPEIVRVFTTAIKKIDEYVASLQVHWSDFETLARPEAERKKIPEVDEVRECLVMGLERVLGAFNEYLMSMGMSRLETQEAKKCVSRGPEMAVAR
ncbi:hypothetical protein BU26DRAFT_445653 [Trematosphaeria pertusa]|uniref:Nuclear envelope protein n=1 Tax=Trematosphaeria pertusa TaxID=390896 RepID=A0A6A6J461_9PLEO|nr:uncharacterized protein BU26DRAFT_445653 [Trematosphaeria pertusa]KAF2256680.1 hypothetical protein BU26DRAFT_445653 [Trematosphaeria pertusa]